MLDLPFANHTTYPGHSGVDFPYRSGTPVLSSGNGTVKRSGWINSRAGYGLDIAYDGGPTVLYCHFRNTPSLRTGARVTYGQVIGYVGSTGNSTGPHLHLEIMVGKGASTYAGVWNYFSKTSVVRGGGGSNQVTKDRQNWLNSRGWSLVVDGIEGPLTRQAYKEYQTFLRAWGYGGAIDGIWGGGTQSAHQRFYDSIHTPQANNPFGISDVRGLQKIARLYGYKGALDNIWGSGSASGFAQFLRGNHGYRGNDVLGPVMWSSIARWLRGRWGYVGNDVPGPVMRAALSRANDANWREL